MTFFEQSVFFGVSVSLAAYGIGVLLQKKFMNWRRSCVKRNR